MHCEDGTGVGQARGFGLLPMPIRFQAASAHRPCWPETSSTHCEVGTGVG
ncbi:hypothetical protein MHI12_02715 [Paenibacillus sp. FSL H8-0280]